MKQYKYTLDSSSKKFICPSCGSKRFVRYIETKTKTHCDSYFGRCDKTASCGFLADPPSGAWSEANSFIDRAVIKNTLSRYEMNPLFARFSELYGQKKTTKAFRDYRVGTADLYDGSAVFYQIDEKERIRTGKIIGIDPATGRRFSDEQGHQITWVHSALKLPDFHPAQCLFGLHLLSQETNRIVVVEKEEKALQMRLKHPDITFMATGSVRGFNHETLAPLKDYRVTALPDDDTFDQWHKTATTLNSLITPLNEYGFAIDVKKTGWKSNKQYRTVSSQSKKPGDEG